MNINRKQELQYFKKNHINKGKNPEKSGIFPSVSSKKNRK